MTIVVRSPGSPSGCSIEDRILLRISSGSTNYGRRSERVLHFFCCQLELLLTYIAANKADLTIHWEHYVGKKDFSMIGCLIEQLLKDFLSDEGQSMEQFFRKLCIILSSAFHITALYKLREIKQINNLFRVHANIRLSREQMSQTIFFFILARPFLGKFVRSLENIFNTCLQ